MRCLEDVVWGNEFHEDLSQCWKMTSLCRDVFVSAHMDEFGRGATKPGINTGIPDTFGVALGLMSGLLASLAIYWVVRGGFSRREDDPYGNVEFTPVPAREPVAPENELT